MRRAGSRLPRASRRAPCATSTEARRHNSNQYLISNGYIRWDQTALDEKREADLEAALQQRGFDPKLLTLKQFHNEQEVQNFSANSTFRPDSPMWGYVYGEDLVQKSLDLANLAQHQEYRRGYLTTMIDALTRKMRRHYPKLDYQAQITARNKTFAQDNTSSQSYVDACADLIANDGLLDDYAAAFNSTQKFDEDDPHGHYIRRAVEARRYALSKYSWDRNSDAADYTEYTALLTKFDGFLAPKVAAFEKASGRKLAASLAEFLKSGAKDSVKGFVGFAAGGSQSSTGHPLPDGWQKDPEFNMVAYQSKALTAFLTGKDSDTLALLLGSVFKGCPDFVWQFIVKPANADAFIADNGASIDEAINAWAAQSKALDAFGAACKGLPASNLSAAAASVGAARPGNYFTARNVADLQAKAEQTGDIGDKIAAKVAVAEQNDSSWGVDAFNAVLYPARGGIDSATLQQVAAGFDEDKAGVRDFLTEAGITVDDKAFEAAVAASKNVGTTSATLSSALDKLTYNYDFGEIR